ncbi:MAG: hypothetical protein PUC47_13860, partial [Oscillospiraceae bacterium]|nr:hypothetical protein [Oscillospiraceae bacterium]
RVGRQAVGNIDRHQTVLLSEKNGWEIIYIIADERTGRKGQRQRKKNGRKKEPSAEKSGKKPEKTSASGSYKKERNL